MTNSEEAEARARVVQCALEWEGTPYVHEARLKKIACDCTFVAVVYEEAGIVPHIAIKPYSSQWHLHKREELYLSYVLAHAREIDATPQPGDLVLYKFGRVLSHAGIVIDPGWPHIIHAAHKERMVTRALGDAGIMALPQIKRRYFTLF